MLERHVVVPVAPDRLWQALTDPAEVARWFGARVEWDLRPGGRARFLPDDGPPRVGRVESVTPGQRLVFRWWPDGEEEQASEVSYRLEPDGDATRLIVTEQPVATPAASARLPHLSGQLEAGGSERWSRWDDQLLGVWAGQPALAARV